MPPTPISPRRRSKGIALALVAATILATAPRTASADQACIAAYEQTQTLRKDGKLVSAKAQAALCARAECPALLTKDCSKWLAELESSTPTVVLDAKTPAGAERTDVRVKVDGAPLVTHLDGKAVAVDPGPRRFTFEAEGAAPVETTLTVKEGEKNRKVTVTIADAAPAASSDGARPIPTGFWIFGGVSLVAFATTAIFAIDGLAKKSDLDTCRPRCAADDVDAMNRSFTFADVALGAGIVAGAAAAYLYFTRPVDADAGASGRGSARARPFVTPLTGGGAVGLSARF